MAPERSPLLPPVVPSRTVVSVHLGEEVVMTKRSQQGTGINRAPITPGTLTDEQCVDAAWLAGRNAASADDYAHLIDVLGITEFGDLSMTPVDSSDDAR